MQKRRYVLKTHMNMITAMLHLAWMDCRGVYALQESELSGTSRAKLSKQEYPERKRDTIVPRRALACVKDDNK